MNDSYDYWWIWCLFLVIGFGGCIGSFVNVVIYRLPRNIALGDPRWSFCPNCETVIKWYDNVPLLSYFRLRGHCRTCACPISPRYLIIEVITVVMFLILFDAFFVASVRHGIIANAWNSVAYRFYTDWPIFAAHALLFSCLLAMSVIDLEQYWVDIRFTHFAALCGFLFHALWTPTHSTSWLRSDAILSAAAISATVVAIITHLIVAAVGRRRAQFEQHEESLGSTSARSEDEQEAGQPQISPTRSGKKSLGLSAYVAGLVFLFTVGMLVTFLINTSSNNLEGPRPVDTTFAIRILPGMAFAFCALIAATVIKRDADQEIEEALDAERHQARKVVLLETATLLPTVIVFIATILVLREGGVFEHAWADAWQWSLGRSTRPLLGLGTAAAGFVIAGAIGWTVRIFFTLILGKEAFGVGDIHIMAAAGAVAGWEVVLIGFFLSSLLALLGKTITLPFKRGHALPMGPWLTLALFITVLYREPIVQYFEPILKIWPVLFPMS